jgi:hypothetical protein
VIFQLPAGYRPKAGKLDAFPAACECNAGVQTTNVVIAGSGYSATFDGSVSMLNGNIATGAFLSLDGISFKAES